MRRDRERALVQAHDRCEPFAPPLLGIVGDQRIIYRAPGLEYGVFVDNRGFLLLRLAQMQRSLETTALENGKCNRRSDDKLA